MSETSQPPRHRLRRVLLWGAGIVLLLPLALVALVVLVANTGPGQRLLERRVAGLTGNMVVLRGLSGRFPDALRLAHAEIRDAQGVWLSLDDVVLNWSPMHLLGRVAAIDTLSAGHVLVARLPAPTPQAQPAKPSQGGLSLPVRVTLRALHVARLDLGAALAGAPAALRVDGAGQFKSLDDTAATLALQRLDAAGSYRLEARIDAAAIGAMLAADEPAAGLVGGLAKLPQLGPLALHASLQGPRAAERTALSLNAGALHASAAGSIDLVHGAASLDVAAGAPAMAPRADLAWDGVALQAHIQGPFTRPDVSAHAQLTNVKGGGATIAALTLDATGNRGTLDAHAVLAGLRLPGPRPDLFAASPLDFTAHAALDKPARPIAFKLVHPVVTADGIVQTGGDIAATIHTVVPDLAPLAAIGGIDLQGRTEATASMAVHGRSTDVAVDGTAAFTGGLAPVPALLGQTSYGATASLAGGTITISRAVVDSARLHASVTGTDAPQALALAFRLALTDLAAASPQLAGTLQATGRLDGPTKDLALQADVTGDIGTQQVARGPLTAAIHAQGLPANPSGTITAQGRLAGAALALDASAQRNADGSLHAVLQRASWKSLAAEADMVLARGETLPVGHLHAAMTRLADLAPLIGQPVSGSVQAKVETARDVRLDVQGRELAFAKSALSSLTVTGTVRDPLAHPSLALIVDAAGLNASGTTGRAHLTANGPQDALVLAAQASLVAQGQPATLSATARVDAGRKQALLQTLAADYRAERLRLAAPARVDFGAVTGVDALRLTLGGASLALAGRIAPSLALTATIRNVTPDLARPFAPDLQASGLLAADARLTGTIAAPQGSIRIQGSGFRLRTGPAASLPPASLLAAIELHGASARLDAHVNAGPRLALEASGTAPLQAGAALAIHATGTTDLRLLDPILNAGGQRAAGNLALDATLSGSTAAPRLDGTFTLDRGEIQDFVQGLHITDIAARLVAQGDTVRIERLHGTAGPGGTLAASGSIGVLAQGVPVDLHITASHARPLASDLLTATLDGDLTLRGQASAEMLAQGRILVRRADINIPNALPPSVAVLHVRRPGDHPPTQRSAPPATIRLALEVDAPSGIFVRGHGLDSELGGKLTIGGTAAAPQIGGGFQLRRGTIAVAGTTLTFSKGEVGFDGTGVTNKVDPTLDFVADSVSGSVTATLTVGGYADAPKITLSSVPDLPQDEVLAHLLFGVSIKDLSAIQIAEIAAALAELSGVTGGGGDPLGAVRRGLGLDRLSVGGGSSGTSTGATIEAGRYVARGVYVGAKQATSGGGTAAVVQVDITRRLKAQAQLATGGGSVQGATPENDPGSTIGLSYQFDY